jgi:hypothetical protein
LLRAYSKRREEETPAIPTMSVRRTIAESSRGRMTVR